MEHLTLTRAIPNFHLFGLVEFVESSPPEWAPPAPKAQTPSTPESSLDFYESWQGISW